MSSLDAARSYILTLSCPDRVGIVAAISGHLARIGGFIVDSQQYADLDAGRFFLRIEFKADGKAFPGSLEELRAGLSPIAKQHEMNWELLPSTHRPKLLIAVSKGSHCLNDLLHRWQTGNLPVDIVGVVSNHPDLRGLAEWHGVPFHYLPVSADKKDEQEAELLSIFARTAADYLVLARYMQVLSSGMADRLSGRCLNIHHSFLPSFKGARPYHRAHERGVKLIGATAHFVTRDLDEGPIIEQDVERVDHRATDEDLVRIGRDIEARVLARAVRWTAERRVFLNGIRTVVSLRSQRELSVRS
ncbi:formyltetrahydrofolate deformylase [Parafrankia sp. BMG5.11]|uniref:formyltetrahydrofolate deformylase n=1 Tax=Parafrankia sp. BMG5.11 TaxID=222540 RepID=UPI001039804E|nr:formyltetrahydrofolate deformylase [Parafrankia sp. BMG5.11]TCJ39094.1 formyltetrahydrofolate deformylase [Parafrankia sp. BMG5.11]